MREAAAETPFQTAGKVPKVINIITVEISSKWWYILTRMVFSKEKLYRQIPKIISRDTSIASHGGDVMKIGFIGAGKVGFSLGRYLKDNEYTVIGYYSRSMASAEDAANFTGTKIFDTMKQIVEVSDVLFLTIPDGEIASVWDKLMNFDLTGKVICHCSGALSSHIFSNIENHNAYGYSVHPFLAISDKYKSHQDIKSAFFTIEGSNERLDEVAKIFTSCGNRVQVISPENKVKYHAAASIVSNFAVTLSDMAAGLLAECGFGEDNIFAALGPIMLGNTKSIIQNGTAKALTGPIERGDTETVKKHISVLSKDDRELYICLAKRTLELAKRKHPDRDYMALMEVLQ